MEPRLYRVILPVGDIEAAARWYGALLKMPGERVSPGRHYFHCGGCILACYDACADGDVDAEAERFRPNPEHVYLAVDDLQACHERAAAADCSWLEEKIRRRPWGEVSFYCRDPWDNPLCFVSRDSVFEGAKR